MVNAPITGSRIEGGKVVAGGRAFMTKDNKLVFEPLETKTALTFLRLGGLAAGISGLGVAKKAIDSSGWLKPMVVPMSDATSVEVFDGSWKRPPIVRTNFANGSVVDLGVLASPLHTNGSAENKQAAVNFAAEMRSSLNL